MALLPDLHKSEKTANYYTLRRRQIQTNSTTAPPQAFMGPTFKVFVTERGRAVCTLKKADAAGLTNSHNFQIAHIQQFPKPKFTIYTTHDA